MLLKIIVIIILAVFLLNYIIDFAFYLKSILCRYHIGKWDRESWEAAVEKTSCRWLKRTPVVKITDNSRYILLDVLNGKYRSHSIQSWQKAALILGLLESNKDFSVNKAKETASLLVNEDGSWKQKPTRVDCGMLSYALMSSTDDLGIIKGAMDESVAVIRNSINDEGLISYTGQKDNPDMYVDTIGLCCPFLVQYAKEFHLPEYETIAYRQMESYHTNGLLQSTILPNHAYSLEYKLPLGVYGWGRGIGWYVIGLMDSYENLMNEDYQICFRQWILEAAEGYKVFQRKDGGFGSIVQSPQTYDSSATAALAWFYAKCGMIFKNDEYKHISEKCLDKLLHCTRKDGAIDFCQGDTKGIGVFSQTYDIMPFAQGMALRAIHTLKT